MNHCVHLNAEQGKKPCRLTDYKKCPQGGCVFYITREEADKSLERAHARLRSLPLSDQRSYAEKYYDGQMPWDEK